VSAINDAGSMIIGVAGVAEGYTSRNQLLTGLGVAYLEMSRESYGRDWQAIGTHRG